MLKLFLQRIRLNLRNLFAKKIKIPSKIYNFVYSYPNYHELLFSYLLTNINNEVNYSKKIFGKIKKSTFELPGVSDFEVNTVYIEGSGWSNLVAPIGEKSFKL